MVVDILHIAGVNSSPGFHKTLVLAKRVVSKVAAIEGEIPSDSVQVQVTSLTDMEWSRYVKNQLQSLMNNKKNTSTNSIPALPYQYESESLCTVEVQGQKGSRCVIGNAAATEAWIGEKYGVYCSPEEDHQYFCEMADICFDQYLYNLESDLVYLTVNVNDEVLGRIIIELFNSKVPKTCKNFFKLCSNRPKGVSEEENKEADIDAEGEDEGGEDFSHSYINTDFHRVVPGGWIQGGDVIDSSGKNGISIYGKNFQDESFQIPHNCKGIVGMANHGPHTNNSQFYITCADEGAPYLDGFFVAFGRVVRGAKIVSQIENLPCVPSSGRPCDDAGSHAGFRCYVSDSGEYVPVVEEKFVKLKEVIQSIKDGTYVPPKPVVAEAEQEALTAVELEDQVAEEPGVDMDQAAGEEEGAVSMEKAGEEVSEEKPAAGDEEVKGDEEGKGEGEGGEEGEGEGEAKTEDEGAKNDSPGDETAEENGKKEEGQEDAPAGDADKDEKDKVGGGVAEKDAGEEGAKDKSTEEGNDAQAE